MSPIEIAVVVYVVVMFVTFGAILAAGAHYAKPTFTPWS